MTYRKTSVRKAKETLLAARVIQEAELTVTRGYALGIIFGILLASASSLGELGNLFAYWRVVSEDRFGGLSNMGYAVTLSFSIASFVALAYAIHAGLNWMRGRDDNPPFVSVTIGILSLALSIGFPIFQAGAQEGVLMRSLFSLLLTVVAGLAFHQIVNGFDFKTRHEAAARAIRILDDCIDSLARVIHREGNLLRRMDNMDANLKERFAANWVQSNDDALDALTLAVESEGLPVAPIEGRIRKLLEGGSVNPRVAQLIDLSAGTTAIGLYHRFSGRSMSTAEISAVRRFLEIAHRPTQADVLLELNT